MAYSRREIHDFKTVITAALYNNLQDGIEELFKQISLVTETGIPKLMVFPLFEVATEESQTVFPINLSTFDVNTDTVFVHSGRTTLAPEQDYTIENNTIVLSEGVPKGRTILIYIFKNVPIGEEGSVSGSVIADKTLPLKKLAEMPSAEDVGARPDDWMPTASDVGAASMYAVVWTPTNGETLLGYISDRIRNGFESGVIQIFDGIPSDIPTVFGAYALCKYQKHGDSFVHVILTVDGSLYTEQAKFIYGETSWDVGWSTVYLPLTGGTLSGTLKIVKNTYPLISFVNESVGNYAEIICGNKNVQIICRDKNGDESKQRVIQINDSSGVSNKNNALQFVDKVSGTNSYYHIFGEHNKPSGSYTGNGSATSRTVNVGAIGSVLRVTGAGYFGLVSSNGGLFVYHDGTVKGVSNSNLKYINGTLTIIGTDDAYNKSGTTYNYEAL